MYIRIHDRAKNNKKSILLPNEFYRKC